MCRKNRIQLFILRLQYALFCITRRLQPREKVHQSDSISSTSLKESTFTALDDEGKETVCNVLFTFDSDEGMHYIVYTDITKDQEGNIQLYASRYTTLGDSMDLQPLETEEEWNMIQDTLNDIQERMKNGESLDGPDVDEDDEILEPIFYMYMEKAGRLVRENALSGLYPFPVYPRCCIDAHPQSGIITNLG